MSVFIHILFITRAIACVCVGSVQFDISTPHSHSRAETRTTRSVLRDSPQSRLAGRFTVNRPEKVIPGYFLKSASSSVSEFDDVFRNITLPVRAAPWQAANSFIS